MAGLLDFLQSASNAAASNVTGPVDGIAWLLRKAGIPVPDAPVGSSDWAKRHGLMRDVPQSAASVAGETVGLLSPMVAAAKAPQIAKGLLQAGDNLAAPRTMSAGMAGGERGMLLVDAKGRFKNPDEQWFHASPETFDKFDLSKFGSGGFDRLRSGGSGFTPAIYATTSKAHAADNYGDNVYKLAGTFRSAEIEKVKPEMTRWAKENGFKSAQEMIDKYYEKNIYAALDVDWRLENLLKRALENKKSLGILDFGDLMGDGKRIGKIAVTNDPSKLTILERNGIPLR